MVAILQKSTILKVAIDTNGAAPHLHNSGEAMSNVQRSRARQPSTRKFIVSSVGLAYLGLHLLCGLGLTASYVTSVRAQIAAPTAAMTIGAFLDGLRGVVQQLEQSASSLLAQGNNSLAQQQLILAGTITQTITQISTAYAGALDKTFGQLNTAEMNTFTDLATTVNQLTNLEGKTANDVQNLVYQTQGAANQLLDRLPLTKRFRSLPRTRIHAIVVQRFGEQSCCYPM
jgi:hypothetical protein